MRNILNLFGKSPFAPLSSHMEKVSDCVRLLDALFKELEQENEKGLEEVAHTISEKEHQADLTKNGIRNHLPKGLFLAIDRESLLEILALQDSIADKAEDVAVLATLQKIRLLPQFRKSFALFLQKNISCFEEAHSIIRELHELLESSFGGIEAEKVNSMVEKVAYQEHEADILQRELLKEIFSSENALTMSTFHLWLRIVENLSQISNLSEKLANRIRMTLELK